MSILQKTNSVVELTSEEMIEVSPGPSWKPNSVGITPGCPEAAVPGCKNKRAHIFMSRVAQNIWKSFKDTGKQLLLEKLQGNPHGAWHCMG
jgi:hypothetical protein